MMKKSILFVIDSLNCAGAEKSLVSLLSLIDYSTYEVDLQLFSYGGELERLIPSEVHLLPKLSYTKFADLSLLTAVGEGIFHHKRKELLSRLSFSYVLRRSKYNNPEKARLWWQYIGKHIENSTKEYDYAISYAQGVPTFYVSEKVRATRKFAWVNIDYRLNEKEQLFQYPYYKAYEKIVTVSSSAREVFIETFKLLEDKVVTIYDINVAKLIQQMAELEGGFEDEFEGIRLLTIGRLAYQKGYEMAVESAALLKQKGISFRWYALGKGPLEADIRALIKEKGLEEEFILLGVTPNPYPYIKACDIYVQTSRHEGFGLAIAEARLLNKPVVTTCFEAVFNQMIDGKNGLVVDMSSVGIAEGIIKLIEEDKLRENIVEYLKKEKKGNEEEIEKFYELLEPKIGDVYEENHICSY